MASTIVGALTCVGR